MLTGAITSYIDVAQLVLYVFWGFFACLIIYLRREDKREGYPLESDRSNNVVKVPVIGFPSPPKPKVFQLPHGGTYEAPNYIADDRPVAAEPTAPWPGAPLEPTGNAMTDAVGAAAYAQRSDAPELTIDGEPKIVPLRLADGYSIESRDPDPRGMDVIGGDGSVGGSVADVWVDRSEPQVRYLEIAVAGSDRHVLAPMALARVMMNQGQIKVNSIFSDQFNAVPGIASAGQVTQLEEDKICAYYAGGNRFASAARQEAWL